MSDNPPADLRTAEAAPPSGDAAGPRRSDDRLYIRAARGVAETIVRRGLVAGDRLPSEADLTEELGVSRATLREALVALDVSGVVRLRRGATPVVRDPAARLLESAVEREAGPLEILRVRLLIEPEAARLAAERKDESALAAMEASIERMLAENEAGFSSNVGDREFHTAVARGSGNSALEGVVVDLWRMREMGRLWRTLETLTDVAGRRTRAVIEHMRVLEAIRAREPARAEAAMRAHLRVAYTESERVGVVQTTLEAP